MLEQIVSVIHALVALVLIGLILLHAGRGGGLSDVFGGGGAGGGFQGSSVVQRNLDRYTVLAALVFGATTFVLVFIGR